MEQRCAEAAAFASSASAVRGQLEAQLLRSDDACAEAEARAEALRQEMEQMQVGTGEISAPAHARILQPLILTTQSLLQACKCLTHACSRSVC